VCARFVKSGRKALRPYILVSVYIVLGFGILGQPLCSVCMFWTSCRLSAFKRYQGPMQAARSPKGFPNSTHHATASNKPLRACEQYLHYSSFIIHHSFAERSEAKNKALFQI